MTGPEGRPDAVLIRALESVTGIETMLELRVLDRVQRRVAGGPGLFTQSLGLTIDQDGLSLMQSNKVWLERDETQEKVHKGNVDIIASPRVGVDYAGEDAKRPWRFRLRESKFTSPAK